MISVIVPVYNVEAWLLRCLESIAAQTYKDFEAILVDDGSTDSSGIICDTFCAKDSRFRVIHQKNQWLSGARNTGLREAQGDYVYFIDSDDYIHVSALESLYNAISYGYEMAMFDFKKTSRSDEDIYTCSDCGLINSNDLIINDGSSLINGLLGYSEDERWKSGVAWNKLYSRKLIHGLYFNNIFGCEDMDFNYRVYLRVKKVIHVKKELYFYLQRPDSIVGDASKQNQRLYNRVIVINNMLSYTELNNKTYRERVLIKLYRTILTTRYHFHNTSIENDAERLYAKILSETKKEFLRGKGIALREKIQFLLLWRVPFLMRLYMKYTGN